MGFTPNEHTIANADEIFTISADVEATVSERVNFHTQIVAFGKMNNIINFRAEANSHDSLRRNSKSIGFYFHKDIKSGTYPITEVPTYPIEEIMYFEAAGGRGVEYLAISGYITVNVIKNNPETLHYETRFDLICSAAQFDNKDLSVVGKSTFIVVTPPKS